MDLGLFPYIIGVVLTGMVIGIVYIFRLKPSMEHALPNEEDCGPCAVPLPQLGKVNEGRMDTARNYFVRYCSENITKTPDETEKKNLIAFSEILLKFKLYAQRVGRNKIFYFFDADPMDPANYLRDTHGMRWIAQPMASMSLGVHSGFEWISVKLSTVGEGFKELERQGLTLLMQGASNLQFSAMSKEEILNLKEQLSNKNAHLNSALSKLAEKTSELDRCKSALGQKPLTQPEGMNVPGAFGAKLKQWFTWPQILVAGVCYLASGQIMIMAGYSNLQPPYTTYFAALVTIIGFFSIPFFKKLFGRWL